MPKASVSVPELPPAKFVAREGCQLAYFVAGDAKGVPIVLCHGLAASGLQFVDDARWFAAHGYFVIVPDVRGHGRSQLDIAAKDSTFSVRMLAEDMLAILDAEKLSAVHWVGNSLGGIIALDMMGVAAERFLSFISFGTSYRLGLPQFAVEMSGYAARLAGSEILAGMFAPMTCREPQGQAIIAAMVKQTDIDAAVAIGKQVHDYDLIANALAFDKPILMLRGNLDTQVNWALDSTLTAMKARDNFTLIDIKDAGHCANLDKPIETRQRISTFIESL